MNKLFIVLMCMLTLTACQSMNIRPTVGVSVGSAI